MKTRKKVNFVNKRGKITGSVIVEETELKPNMNLLDSYFDMFFVKPRMPFVIEFIKTNKKKRKT